MTLEEFYKTLESKKNSVVINRSVTPLSLLGVAFVVLKLTGTIAWSWWWVLAPFWIPLGIVSLALIFAIIALFIIACKIKVQLTGTEKNKSEEPSKKEETPKKTSSKKKNTNGRNTKKETK